VGKNTNQSTIDLFIIAAILPVSFVFFGRFDILEKIVELSSKYENYEIDELVSTIIVLVFCLGVFSIRKWREMVQSKKIVLQKNKKLEDAINEIKQLKKILPLCSFCKKIRNDSGYWEQVDWYIQKNSWADISHSLCPECMEKKYPTEYAAIYSDNDSGMTENN
jgi:hypothetical protein